MNALIGLSYQMVGVSLHSVSLTATEMDALVHLQTVVPVSAGEDQLGVRRGGVQPPGGRKLGRQGHGELPLGLGRRRGSQVLLEGEAGGVGAALVVRIPGKKRRFQQRRHPPPSLPLTRCARRGCRRR